MVLDSGGPERMGVDMDTPLHIEAETEESQKSTATPLVTSPPGSPALDPQSVPPGSPKGPNMTQYLSHDEVASSSRYSSSSRKSAEAGGNVGGSVAQEGTTEKERGNAAWLRGDGEAAVQHWKRGLRTVKYILTKGTDNDEFREV
eukprot:GHVT01081248.1.p3 GENE.GHVT01081248.1~~GHVT01081248.1.p3  ORF type:complete len:145 (-),score=23.30 GHVT01081248.1:3369-3803(-)